MLSRVGITFSVYGEGGDPEQLIPFDVIPRVLMNREWGSLARGLTQRVRAPNMFMADVYGAREILRSVPVPVPVPEVLVLGNEAFRPKM